MKRATTDCRKFLIAAAIAALGGIAIATVRPAISQAQTQPLHSQHPQTQLDLDMAADNEFNAADAKLNAVYKRLLTHLDDKSKAKLKATQRAWIAFRDDEADFHADATVRGGSLFPMSYSETRRDLTKQRTQELQELLDELSH